MQVICHNSSQLFESLLPTRYSDSYRFTIKGNKLNVSLWPVNPVGLLELIVRFLSLCCHSEI